MPNLTLIKRSIKLKGGLPYSIRDLAIIIMVGRMEAYRQCLRPVHPDLQAEKDTGTGAGFQNLKARPK